MILALENKTHPEVEILSIDIEHGSVTFRNSDGVCSAPLGEYKGDLPTADELAAAVSGVLGEAE